MFRRLIPSIFVFITITAVLIAGGNASSKLQQESTTTIVAASNIVSPENDISEALKSALDKAPKTVSGNKLRKFPYPYDAMLSVSSDTDLNTVEKFEAYHRFLNTHEQTPYGQGLGLDIGDSFWLFIGSDHPAKIDEKGHTIEYSMSYFQGLNPDQPKDKAKIICYFKAGWIDSIHSFGDFSRNDEKTIFTRNLAVEAWKAIKESGLQPKVWINHGSPTNVQNFGAYNPQRQFFDYQAGDNPESPYYHTDLTIDNGIRYVWNSEGMDQFAFDNPLFPIKLRDGRQVWGFYRYTNDLNEGKIDWTWETNKLPLQITKQRLDQLIQERKYSIVAQHLGKGNEDFPFNPAEIQTLQLLKAYQDQGKVLIARSVRLLDYARAQQFIQYSSAQIDGKTYINVNSISDPLFGSTIPYTDEIRGLTFYTDDPENTYILLNYQFIPPYEIQRNGPDRDGKKSIGVRWFKQDFTDYTKNQ